MEEPLTALASARDVKRVLSVVLETALQLTPPGGKMEVRVSLQRALEGASAVLVDVACRTASGAPAQGAGAGAGAGEAGLFLQLRRSLFPFHSLDAPLTTRAPRRLAAAGATGWVADGVALASSLAAQLGGSVSKGRGDSGAEVRPARRNPACDSPPKWVVIPDRKRQALR